MRLLGSLIWAFGLIGAIGALPSRSYTYPFPRRSLLEGVYHRISDHTSVSNLRYWLVAMPGFCAELRQWLLCERA
jgi:hypothetical protein